ncbi:Gfo/Idh/MocA family protein [Halalkalibacter alkalisediminis]|uniref:Gfo/Idh/MocA family protein n=1 Tax=Halalkalibacter alkalisediminis TaxID=935616 RepID=A0ABV6NKL6_9BACI|nr:Gfo/Idh/MocA family oxidoreductase [Halalkalibacter alkalisediminis]
MTLHIGMVGTGWFSRKHADHLSKMVGVRVQSICGTSKEKADDMAASYEGAKGYGQIKEMLDTEQLDAVYVCVPPMSHGDIETELIDRNIPFLVEKPLGVDLNEPKLILSQMEKTSLITSVGYHFRYKQSVKRLKESIGNQTIGLVSGQWMGPMPEVAWWRKQEGSGGQFIEQTTHIFDLLRYVAGEVDEVFAFHANRVNHKKYDHVTVADVGTVSFKMKSGVIATISNTCILPNGISQVGLTLFTDQGIIDWQPDRLSIIEPNGSKVEELGSDNPYIKESEAFLHAVRTGDTSGILSDYRDAYQTQVVTCAALESALKGVPIKIEHLG